MSSWNMSVVEATGNQSTDMQLLFDIVNKMRKELNYGMSFLDEENVPVLKVMQGDIESNYTLIEQNSESITLLAADVAGNTASIQVNSNQISLNVSDIAQNTSSISVLSNQISLKVDYNGVISAINLSPESITISAAKINLSGVTTMDGLTRVFGVLSLGTPFSNYAVLNMGTGVRLEANGSQLDVTGNFRVYGNIFANSVSDASGNSLSSLDARVSALEGGL